MINADKTNISHNSLLIDRQVVRLCKIFTNKLSKDVKLQKTQLSKIIHSDGFLGIFPGSLMKVGLE